MRPLRSIAIMIATTIALTLAGFTPAHAQADTGAMNGDMSPQYGSDGMAIAVPAGPGNSGGDVASQLERMRDGGGLNGLPQGNPSLLEQVRKANPALLPGGAVQPGAYALDSAAGILGSSVLGLATTIVSLFVGWMILRRSRQRLAKAARSMVENEANSGDADWQLRAFEAIETAETASATDAEHAAADAKSEGRNRFGQRRKKPRVEVDLTSRLQNRSASDNGAHERPLTQPSRDLLATRLGLMGAKAAPVEEGA